MLEISEDAVGALVQMGPLRVTAEETDDGVELRFDVATEPHEGDAVVERD